MEGFIIYVEGGLWRFLGGGHDFFLSGFRGAIENFSRCKEGLRGGPSKSSIKTATISLLIFSRRICK